VPALNRVQLIGNLGRDPELRYTPKGTPFTRFTVAVNRGWTSQDGERHTETEWFNIEAWGKLGEICNQYLRKGRLVYIEGELCTDRWEDDKGDQRTFVKVHTSGMQMLDRKPEEPEGAEAE
jgi:single-strand DNA-binding protein